MIDMRFLKRLSVALTAFVGHKSAWAATVGAAAGVTAEFTASHIGRDPMPWIIGAMAVTVVYAYKQPENKRKALANGIISIFLGGVGAPYVGQILTKMVDPIYANDWILAGILGAGWPWLVPIVFDFFKRRGERYGNGS